MPAFNKKINAIFFIFFFLVFKSSCLAAMEFTIDEIEGELKEINYDQEIKVLFSFKNVSGEKTYYIQGAFKEENSSKYFGWTKNNEQDYYRYEESDCHNFYKIDIEEASVSASLWLKPDYESSNFKGTGNYILKLYRFTDSCKSKTNSDNSLTLKINAPPSPSPSQSPSPSPQFSPSPSALVFPSPSPSPVLLSPSPSSYLSPSPSVEKETKEASFGGEVFGASISGQQENQTTRSAEKKEKNKKHLPLPLVISLTGLLFLAASAFPWIKKFLKKLEIRN